jgi:hypothetical protein
MSRRGGRASAVALPRRVSACRGHGTSASAAVTPPPPASPTAAATGLRRRQLGLWDVEGWEGGANRDGCVVGWRVGMGGGGVLSSFSLSGGMRRLAARTRMLSGSRAASGTRVRAGERDSSRNAVKEGVGMRLCSWMFSIPVQLSKHAARAQDLCQCEAKSAQIE